MLAHAQWTENSSLVLPTVCLEALSGAWLWSSSPQPLSVGGRLVLTLLVDTAAAIAAGELDPLCASLEVHSAQWRERLPHWLDASSCNTAVTRLLVNLPNTAVSATVSPFFVAYPYQNMMGTASPPSPPSSLDRGRATFAFYDEGADAAGRALWVTTPLTALSCVDRLNGYVRCRGSLDALVAPRASVALNVTGTPGFAIESQWRLPTEVSAVDGLGV